MNIAIITNMNGKGLELDAHLLRQFLMDLGHWVPLIQFDQPCTEEKFDLAISLEVINENFFSLAPKHVWIPNLEWTKNDYLLHARKFDRIWAKTADAERVLRARFPHVTYTGFLSRDRRLTWIPRKRDFLHVGGDSGLKNTNAVISAWRQWKYWTGELAARLIVVSRSIQTDVVETEGITFHKELTDEQLQGLQNSCLFHLQPSAYEGWGHAIRESQSVGAVLLTTRAGPMTELRAPFEVEPTGERKVYMATAYNVSGREIREKVGVMLEQPSQMIAKYQVDMRRNWEQEYRESKRRMEKALVEVMRGGQVTSNSVTPEGVKPVLAILGNFRPEHSTENDLAWTLRDMGYKVIEFQEDTCPTEDILQGCEASGVELLIFLHTHGWSTPGKLCLDTLWIKLDGIQTKTCSFHLDKFWGLNVNDQRENLIGKHPFWHTGKVFSVDGAHQADFKARGVNHVWLPPGVCKRVKNIYHLRREQPEFKFDVGFVGARDYHDQEYPFRGQLISFLEQTYGDRFHLFQGVRGKDLLDVYASTKVIAGDSCFGGVPRYWSDRVPTTLGYGGFLIHPASEGLNIPGLVTFTPGDLLELKDKIDYYLHEEVAREQLQRSGTAWCWDHETFHNRMDTLLKVMHVA